MKKLLFIFAVILVFISSCQKEENDLFSNSSNNEVILLVPSTATLIDQKSAIQYQEKTVIEAADFAQLLAASINDQSIRSFLKEEANKKFDGDYDILVNKIIDTKIDAVSFKDRISQINSQNCLKSANVFDAALGNEKLNISIPVLIDKWDVNRHELLVAVAVGAIENETKYLNAYDSKGRVYLLDANTEPDVPVIVIANNERIGMDLESSNTEKSARVSGSYEHLGYLKCYDLSKIESWYFGGPEFRINCVIYKNSSATSACEKFLTPSRTSASDGYDPDRDLFQWYFETTHGPDYYFKAWELDNSGTTYSFDVKIPVENVGDATFKISYRAEDKQLLGELINYQTGIPQYLEDDIMKFKLE